jgi:hypothetical protein
MKKKLPRTRKSLRQNNVVTACLRRTIGHMDPTKPEKILLLFLAGILVAAWAIIIWVATVVTQTMLSTLQYIVDLSQMN